MRISKNTYLLRRKTVKNVSTGLKISQKQDTASEEGVGMEETLSAATATRIAIVNVVDTQKTTIFVLWHREKTEKTETFCK